MKQCTKCGRRMLTRNHKRHFDRCTGAGNSASDSQLVSLGRAILYLENNTPEKAVSPLKLSFPDIPSSELWKGYIVARASTSELVAALTPSFSLENCAEEPTQRKRRANEARRWANRFKTFELPDEEKQSKQVREGADRSDHKAQQEKSLWSVPMSTIEVAGESLADTRCPAARPSLVDWMLEGQFYEGETPFPIDQAVSTISTPEWAKEDSDILVSTTGTVAPTCKKENKRPSRWGPELMAINIFNFNKEL
ncbi:hypothetical protein HELRODRAFT_174246 [Helobdella robusta]|uniref:Uncharacterized protein n=1 Tax=Helobdella robusta TaxID=6412 RepID=T1F7V5_HELRO|nr:hypothetical protein HELRODRAFT_174246 [Helobdella robusta]ESO02822.1 hypothetical protein HELRODRAFT_174246 [Helobdella robusta]